MQQTGFIGFPDKKMQAIVVPDLFFSDLLPLIDDLEAVRMARDVAKKIEETMQYPGQIKVMVIRETRAIDFAK